MSTQLHGLLVQPRGRTPECQDSRRPPPPPRRSTPGIWRSAKNGLRPKKPPHRRPPPYAAPGCQLHSMNCASPSLLLRLGEELDLRHLHCRRDPATSLHDHRNVLPPVGHHLPSPSLPSISVVSFIFPRVGHCLLLRFFNVQHDGKADEF